MVIGFEESDVKTETADFAADVDEPRAAERLDGGIPDGLLGTEVEREESLSPDVLEAASAWIGVGGGGVEEFSAPLVGGEPWESRPFRNIALRPKPIEAK